MTAPLDVLAPGTAVRLPGDLRGVVAEVCIAQRFAVTYLVAWWDGATRRSESLEEFEVEPWDDAADRVRIGFRTGSPE